MVTAATPASGPNPFADAAARPLSPPPTATPNWYDVDPNSPLTSPRPFRPSPSAPARPAAGYGEMAQGNVDRLAAMPPEHLASFIGETLAGAALEEDWALLRRLSRDLWLSVGQRVPETHRSSPLALARQISALVGRRGY